MHSTKHRIIAVLIFLIFLEIFLRLGVIANQQVQRFTYAQHMHQKDVYRIMCIGESMTITGGDQSYPSQLQNILNDTPGKKFEVINQGVGGAQTGTIAQNLPQWIDQYQPDMVIAMIGARDAVEDSQKESLLPALKGIRLYQFLEFFQKKVSLQIKKYFPNSRDAAEQKIDPNNDTAMFLPELAKEPEKFKELYFVLGMSIQKGRYDLADALFRETISESYSEILKRCLLRKYAFFLIGIKEYAKFVDIMKDIPYYSWPPHWVEGYCHGQQNMDHVRDIIDGMVVNKKEDAHVYGYVVSCYEEGGRSDLAKIFLDKIGEKSSYYTKVTRKNYQNIKEILLSRNIQPVFVQYPLRDPRSLLSIFEGDMDKDKIIFVDNKDLYEKAIQERSYDFYFVDRALGELGHQTKEGNYLLASHIAAVIKERLPKNFQN